MGKKRVGKLTTRYYGDLLMVEYVNGKPIGAVTSKSGYDFSESDHWGTLFHDHGGGSCYLHPFVGAGPDKEPIGDVWIADGVEVTDGRSLERKVLSAEDIRAMGYRILRAPHGDPFEDARDCEGGTQYCTVCDDYMPNDEECLCDHLTWIDEVGITGPGDADAAPDFSEFMLPVIELAARAGIARTWRRHLAQNKDAEVRITSAVGGLGPEFVRARMGGRDVGDLVKHAAEKIEERDWYAARAAAHWFTMLDTKTTAANVATVAWLDLLIACQNERRASGAPVYALRRCDYLPRSKGRHSWTDALALAKQRRAKGEKWQIVYVRPKAEAT